MRTRDQSKISSFDFAFGVNLPYRPFPSVFSSRNAPPSLSFDRSSLKDQKCLGACKIPSSGIEEKYVDMYLTEFLQFNQ